MVYVTQQPVTLNSRIGRLWTPNLESAAKYGPIKFVFDSDENIVLHANDSLIKAIDALAQFDPITDYLLWPGVADPLSLFCCTAALVANFDIKEINFLAWNRNIEEKKARALTDFSFPHTSNGFYVPIKFSLEP